MNHSTRAPQPHSPTRNSSVRPAYPSCPIEQHSRVNHAVRPSWEDLLGQR
jgi:hypothetical protein